MRWFEAGAGASGIVVEYRADADDLAAFSHAGHDYRQALEETLIRVRSARARTRSLLGVPEAPHGNDRAFEQLLDRATEANQLTTSIARSLMAGWFETDSTPASWLVEAVDAAANQVRQMADATDDVLVDSLPYVAMFPEAAGVAVLGPMYPHVARGVNRRLTPFLVDKLWHGLDSVVPNGTSNGDTGGTFSARPTGLRLIGNDGAPALIGRQAVISAFNDTADGNLTRQDEFEIIHHGDTTYTIVLPGVVDLSSPTAGFDPVHRSVRDTNRVAALSAASTSIADNRYASLVHTSLMRRGVPIGADLMIVGHSFGSDTAIDLAADPTFNGLHYNVTHIVAAAYHSEPQLNDVQPHTEVLVLQNNKDVPVIIENLGHLSTNPFDEFTAPPPGIILREFDGGWRGFGHHQTNYVSYLAADRRDAELTAFFSSVADAGYAAPGRAAAIDITNPFHSSGAPEAAAS